MIRSSESFDREAGESRSGALTGSRMLLDHAEQLDATYGWSLSGGDTGVLIGDRRLSYGEIVRFALDDSYTIDFDDPVADALGQAFVDIVVGDAVVAGFGEHVDGTDASGVERFVTGLLAVSPAKAFRVGEAIAGLFGDLRTAPRGLDNGADLARAGDNLDGLGGLDELADLLTCGANSFTPGTRVLMADGTHTPIKDIQIGDIV